MIRREYVSMALRFLGLQLLFPIEDPDINKIEEVNSYTIGYESAPPETFREAYLKGKRPKPDFGYKTV